MYRVELKAAKVKPSCLGACSFLMYRVELKVVIVRNAEINKQVPNVPCGVERTVGYIDFNLLNIGS